MRIFEFNVLDRSFIVGLLLLLLTSALSFSVIRKANDSSEWVDHTHQVITRLELIISNMKDAETGTRGYLLTGNEIFLQPYEGAADKVSTNVNAVKQLTIDNAQQQQTIPKLEATIQDVLHFIATEIKLEQQEKKVVYADLQQGKQAMDSVRQIISVMQTREQQLLEKRTNQWQTLSAVTPVLIVLVFVTAVAFAGHFANKLKQSYNKRRELQMQLEAKNEEIQKRIAIIQNIATKIAAGDYALRLHENEKDVLGSLSENLNEMASSLEYSFNVLKELNRKKDEFIGIAAHELKTPVASIKAYLQLIARAKLDSAEGAQIYPFVTRANNQINRMSAIVSDLLDVTAINDGKMHLHAEDVAVRDLLLDASREVFMHTRLHNLIIEGNPDIKAHVDRFRIEQVFINLLSNAVKYSAPNTDIIVLVQKLATTASISIKDFGMGIPADKQAYVFERYFRVEESSANQPGLGLGLYIAKNIVKQHGGNITLESLEGQGTTINFTLPLSTS